MGVDFSYSCVRYTFFAFNVLFWFIGFGSLGVGIWLYCVKHDYELLTPANYGATSATGLCIAAGAIVVVLGFVGCCGAIVESKCLLITYFVFVCVVFVVELTAGVLGVLYHDNVSDVIKAQMRVHLEHEFISDAAHAHGARITWDKLQTQFECCGVDRYTDWYHNKAWPDKKYVRDSCCNPDKFPNGDMEHCGATINPDLWYQEGCYEAFREWLMEHVHIMGVLGLTCAAFQFLGLVTSCALYYHIRQRRTTFNQYTYYKQGEYA